MKEGLAKKRTATVSVVTDPDIDNNNDDNNNNEEEEEADYEPRTEIWFREEERWELTWPIWHMLPRPERKALALKHGYQTIGEFEEYMSLQRGLTESSNTTMTGGPYTSSVFSHDPPDHRPSLSSITNRQEQGARQTVDTDVDDVDDVDDEEEEGFAEKKSGSDLEYGKKLSVEDAEPEPVVSSSSSSKEEEPRLVSLALDSTRREGDDDVIVVLFLPLELWQGIFEFLCVDAYATLALTSPHWKACTRIEPVYQRLCERVYLNQSKRRQLHVERFAHSYRCMLEQRPRVRAGGGVYVMKYTKVKPIQRDMWTEIPAGAILEMTYYRYIYFQENGQVLYALTASPPHEMFRRFCKMLVPKTHSKHHHHHSSSAASGKKVVDEEGDEEKTIVRGRYEVQRNHVTVHAKQEWHVVRLDLTIHAHGPYKSSSGSPRWGYLSFDRHQSSASNNFEPWSTDVVTYDVPAEPFCFVRYKRL